MCRRLRAPYKKGILLLLKHKLHKLLEAIKWYKCVLHARQATKNIIYK